jgi:DNA-binding NtrC family response regulator
MASKRPPTPPVDGDPGDEPAADPFAPSRTTVLKDGREHLLVRCVQLRVVGGPDLGHSVTATGERTSIGKHDSCDLALTDPAVSRFHCEIVIEGNRAVVRDLGSRNGTRLDGVEVERGYARAGSIISVGTTRIAIDLGGDDLRLPLSERDRFGRLVGRSAIMRSVFALLERAAGSTATVLVEGETGTGKEAAVEAMHAAGPRRDAPFIIVDCGAVPGPLLESELFGHERGAFTGADVARPGAFEAADGGTIFLDEIGELGVELQPKLLRALERREVKRIGADRYVPVDVRVVAATHRSLQAEVNAHRFRADLFYRLAVIRVHLPPLRERAEDLPLLVEAMLRDREGTPLSAADVGWMTSPTQLAELARHAWPGNVRELRNYVERCLALRQPLPLEPDPREEGRAVADEPHADVDRPLSVARNECLLRFERRYLAELLRRHDNNVTQVARAAGVERSHLYRLLWRAGLR